MTRSSASSVEAKVCNLSINLLAADSSIVHLTVLGARGYTLPNSVAMISLSGLCR